MPSFVPMILSCTFLLNSTKSSSDRSCLRAKTSAVVLAMNEYSSLYNQWETEKRHRHQRFSTYGLKAWKMSTRYCLLWSTVDFTFTITRLRISEKSRWSKQNSRPGDLDFTLTATSISHWRNEEGQWAQTAPVTLSLLAVVWPAYFSRGRSRSQ